MTAKKRPAFVVLNQAQTPAFQAMMESLVEDEGCRVLTGTPHAPNHPDSHIERAPPYDRRSLSKRAISWARFMKVAAQRMMTLPSGSFVLVTTNPPLLPHLAWAFSRSRGLRYAILLWDLYPETFIRAGMFQPEGLPARSWKALNRRAFLQADLVITLGDRMTQKVRAELGADADRCRTVVIPNWGDTDVICPLPKSENPFALEHDQVNKVTVLYSGNIGGTHGMSVLVDAAVQLRDDPRVSFLIIGDGMGRAELERGIQRHGLENMRLLDYQPWARLPYSLTTGDIAVVSQAPGTEDYSFPSKVYSALAAGSAILAITGTDSDLGQLILDREIGVVVPPTEPGAIASALQSLLDAPDRLARLRANARRVAVEEFSATVVQQQFRAALLPLIRTAREA